MPPLKIDTLTVRWYERTGHSPGIVRRWLDAAREHLPEAVPRRFGDHEPLPHRFTGRAEELERACERAGRLLFLAGTAPVIHASWSTRRGRGPVHAHSMQATMGPGDERVRRFALALAHPHLLYLSASVERGATLDDGTLYGPADHPAEPYLAPLGRWLGLPPTAPAWCWFGPAYVRLVRRHVEGEPIAGGLFVVRAGSAAGDRTGDTPVTGDRSLISDGSGPRSGPGAWVPERLQARLHEADPLRQPAPRRPRGPFRLSRPG